MTLQELSQKLGRPPLKPSEELYAALLVLAGRLGIPSERLPETLQQVCDLIQADLRCEKQK